ncbi:MAG: family N-acetyltransferase, partial [Aeromicrobium sp.]|nr:family N-acetyltransferase [Aeromicrobium sp.]
IEADGLGLTRFHSKLSPDTTYMRFFSVHPRLSQREFDSFTQLDHLAREAVVATVDGEIVGVGRFDRLAGGAEAEVAFVVADDWQGQGIGAALFDQVLALAREQGIETLVADTLPTNRRMLAVFHRSGSPVVSTIEGGVVHVRMPVVR